MNIFNYQSYKLFVNDWILTQEKMGRGQFKRISEFLSVSSVHISQIFKGDKDISIEQALKLCKYLGFSELEQRFFVTLVSKSRAGTLELESFYQHELKELIKLSSDLSKRISHDQILSEKHKAIFYSDWKYCAIRLACGLGENDEEKIRELFNLNKTSFDNYFDFLKMTKLIITEAASLKMGPSSTHIPKSSPFVKQHHRNWRMRSLETIDNMKEDEIMYTAPMCISKELFEELNQQILKFIENFVQEAKDSVASDLYFLNIDLRRMI